jgi:hypothetical protein
MVLTDNPLILLVPEPGIEPGWAQGPEDFESENGHFEKPMISGNYIDFIGFFVPKKLGNVRVF